MFHAWTTVIHPVWNCVGPDPGVWTGVVPVGISLHHRWRVPFPEENTVRRGPARDRSRWSIYVVGWWQLAGNRGPSPNYALHEQAVYQLEACRATSLARRSQR